ncbi:extracellular solute-binding protein [Paenibacillus sp. J5C_2022]|uniref:extracellular solute-binding protein n=1 Tax=Paenibacillus sp. J5C2022 TaxID=2977129 RepID=UPI0021CF7FD1|nr:extracellular solute-binding protein [Paenibacillus sp. J5C2022]MCU6708067.1 extracellular solute-binding protein [Paenibacillus sp. J5C2022]
MKRNKRLVVAMLALSVALSACGNGNDKEDEATQNPSATPPSSAEAPDPFGKYEQLVEVRAANHSEQNWRYPEGDSFENNAWTRGYEEELGIKVKYEWTTPSGNYFNKMNIAIASNDLPDIFVVNSSQLRRLAEADQLADLTEAYEQFASPFTKSLMEGDGGLGLKAASFDGKLVGLPKLGSTIYGLPMVWLRTDWMENLGLEAPRTMQDLLVIAEAFTTGDPDRNGKNDTFGLPITKDLYGGIASLNGFFNGYHAYPQTWIKDDSGKVAYGSTMPEMRTALEELQKMFKQGQIDPEFGVKDTDKVVDDFVSGKFGMTFGHNWVPLNFIDMKKKSPEADWKASPLVSVDDQTALGSVGFPATEYTVVRKGFKNPEAVMKLLNFYQENRYGETKDETIYNPDDNNGDQTHVYTSALVMSDKANNVTIADLKNLAEAVSKEDKSILTDYIPEYQKMIDFKKTEDVTGWASTRQGGPEDSGFSILIKSHEGGAYVSTVFGGQTETMSSKWGTLEKLEKETFTKIILGYADITAFDEFVDKWNKLGGEQITDEINHDVSSQ